MAQEMGVLEEETLLMSRLQELEGMKVRMENRLDSLRRGGTPRGAKPGMGYGVGPDRPPSRYGGGGLLT
jgi:hypothetical protein|tara:strand:- start:194 stop:400 length:207 start_codon:yes stop_codon:yes gene_type:complete